MSFNGFGKPTTDYLKDLVANNDRNWFNDNKARYESTCMEPSKAFVEELGERLLELDPSTVAEPRVNGSIFRINRDTRFSKDKTPYKDHLAFRFWTGNDKKDEVSGFMLRFFHDSIGIGVGVHEFSRPALQAYRDAIDDDKTGKAFASIVAKCAKSGIGIGGDLYKKVPREYDADHPRGDLLKFKGIFAYHEGPLPKEFGSAAFTILQQTVQTDAAHTRLVERLLEALILQLRNRLDVDPVSSEDLSRDGILVPHERTQQAAHRRFA